MAWNELGDGIFRQRYESLDLNVGLILSEAAALVIDSRSTHGQAEDLRKDIRSLTSLPVSAQV